MFLGAGNFLDCFRIVTRLKALAAVTSYLVFYLIVIMFVEFIIPSIFHTSSVVSSDCFSHKVPSSSSSAGKFSFYFSGSKKKLKGGFPGETPTNAKKMVSN